MKQQKKIHRIYINSEFKSNNILCTTELSHRITNVLRMKNDEKLSVFNNIREYEACLSIDGKKVSINLIEELPRVKCQNRVCIAVSVINMKLMDMIIQKSVELGATDFYPVYTKRSQYKNVDKKIDHWNKIIISATEQCGRLMMMKIHEPSNLEGFINQHDNKACYLLNPEGDKFSSNDFYQNDITVFIGPEGGFEDNELISFKQNNWKTRSINGNILRTETACISVLTLIENYDSISRHSL